jgi:hypothetical protein
MTVVTLLHHPTTPCLEVKSITVEVSKANRSSLHFCYYLYADLARIRIPQGAMQSRRDELWRHTCFEAFIASANATQYLEFNFSPSTEWAAYDFDGYREGMRAAAITPSNLNVTSSEDTLVLSVEIDVAPLGLAAAERELQLGLCAVIENVDGQISYWAINHSMPKPDFHHRDGFALLLASS